MCTDFMFHLHDCWRSVLLHWVPVADTLMSVYIPKAKYLLLEVSTTTLSPSIWHMQSVHITEAKDLLLEVTTTTLSPSFWHYDVSTREWGKVSTARGLYYYTESQYLTHEVSTHHWGQVSTAKGLLLHWDPVSDTSSQYTWLRQSFCCERSTTTLRPSTWHHDVSKYDCGKVSTAWGQYYYIESQYLTPRCQYTWSRQSFYCWRSVLLH